MSPEQKARELVEEMGFDIAYSHCQLRSKQYYHRGDITQFDFWQSVREHILKLKNEGKVK